MIEHIYVEGPGSYEFGVTGAIGDLHAELVKRFGSAETLDAAYHHALSELEHEDGNYACPQLRAKRTLTPFETAFEEFAQKIHEREGYCEETLIHFALAH